jgi:hypothetical protein
MHMLIRFESLFASLAGNSNGRSWQNPPISADYRLSRRLRGRRALGDRASARPFAEEKSGQGEDRKTCRVSFSPIKEVDATGQVHRAHIRDVKQLVL